MFSCAIAENLLCNVSCRLARSGKVNQKLSQEHSPAVMHGTYTRVTNTCHLLATVFLMLGSWRYIHTKRKTEIHPWKVIIISGDDN